MISQHGDHKWRKNKWYTFDGDVQMCEGGFHCSKGVYQAFSYVHGEILAEVEVKGKHQKEKDKEVWQSMRVVKTWKWTKKDSVLFSIYAARLVLRYFEEKYPNDDRPRKAIEAAELYINHPSDAAAYAACAAAAADAADAAAAYAAYAACADAADAAAARAADAADAAAARAADAADAACADAAAYAACAAAAADAACAAAAYAAYAACADAAAARKSIYKKLDKWMLEYIKNKK